jgi:hypothetical protein
MSSETLKQELLKCSVAPRPLEYSLHDYHIAMSEGPLHYTWTDKPHRLVYDLIAAVKYYAKQEQRSDSEQLGEPVAWLDKFGNTTFNERQGVTALYTTPQQRTWVGLTDEEMQAVVDAQPLVSNINVYFKVIEAKLKEKNT